MAFNRSLIAGMKFEDYINSLLHRPAAQKIHFLMNGITIAGYQYKLFGNRVSGGEVGVSVIDAKKTPGGGDGEYAINDDILILTVDLVLSPYLDMAIVHESTHALLRYMDTGAAHLTYFQNEAIAYIADAVYRRLSGDPLPPNPHVAALQRIADTVAQKIISRDYHVSHRDYAPLRDAIANDPAYRGRDYPMSQVMPYPKRAFDPLLTPGRPAPLLSSPGDM